MQSLIHGEGEQKRTKTLEPTLYQTRSKTFSIFIHFIWNRNGWFSQDRPRWAFLVLFSLAVLDWDPANGDLEFSLLFAFFFFIIFFRVWWCCLSPLSRRSGCRNQKVWFQGSDARHEIASLMEVHCSWSFIIVSLSLILFPDWRLGTG